MHLIYNTEHANVSPKNVHQFHASRTIFTRVISHTDGSQRTDKPKKHFSVKLESVKYIFYTRDVVENI